MCCKATGDLAPMTAAVAITDVLALPCRLDRYHDIANDCPEGVLPEDEIENLVADLREPDLAEALLSLRNKALRESGKRTSKGGDEYVALPPSDPGLVTGLGSGQVDGSGHSSRRVSAGW